MKTFLLSFLLCLSVVTTAAPPPPPGPSAVYPFIDDFETTVPNHVWTNNIIGFPQTPDHGVNGTIGMTINMNQLNLADSTITPFIGPLNSSTQLYFKYRIVDSVNYPGIATQLASDAELYVGMSSNLFGPYTQMVSVTAANHIPSTDFVAVSVPVGINFPAFVSDSVFVKVRSTRGSSGNYFLDIDNFSVANGTPLGISTTYHNHFLINAVGGVLSISGNVQNGSIQIYDLHGKLMLNSSLNQVSGISISDWSEGIYLARIDNQAKKFIVKK